MIFIACALATAWSGIGVLTYAVLMLMNIAINPVAVRKDWGEDKISFFKPLWYALWMGPFWAAGAIAYSFSDEVDD